MPITIKCKECGFIFAEYDEVPTCAVYGMDYLTELLRKHEGKCPKCGRELPTRTKLLEDMKVEVKANPVTLGKSPLVSAFQHDYHRNDYVRIKKRS